MTKRKLKIKQVKSGVHYGVKQRATLRGLGFRRLNETVEREDTPAVRGMIRSVSHLVRVVEE